VQAVERQRGRRWGSVNAAGIVDGGACDADRCAGNNVSRKIRLAQNTIGLYAVRGRNRIENQDTIIPSIRYKKPLTVRQSKPRKIQIGRACTTQADLIR